MLAILVLSDYIPGGKVSLLEQAINRNLLAFFIVVRRCFLIFELQKENNYVTFLTLTYAGKFADGVIELIDGYPVCVTAHSTVYLDCLRFYHMYYCCISGL